jgi:hypothetical protein
VGGPTSDFAATDQLVELVGSLEHHPGPVILVLGGDILDLLQAQGPAHRVSQASLTGGQLPWAQALDRVLGGPDAVLLVRALRRLAGDPTPASSTWSATTTRRSPGTPPPAAGSSTSSASPTSPSDSASGSGPRPASRYGWPPSTATRSTPTTGAPTPSTRSTRRQESTSWSRS